MPALYNANWAYSYGPNLGWFIFILLILVLGFRVSGDIRKVSPKAAFFILAVGFLIIFASGFIARNDNQEMTFSVNDLPSRTGRVRGVVRVATQGTDVPGFVTVGPFLSLRKGLYQVTVRYSSIAPIEQKIGFWDIFDGVRIAAYPLYGTAGRVKVLKASFETHDNWDFHKFQFRTHWNGVSEIQIYGIGLKRLPGIKLRPSI
jgi:hypothetical protein